VESIYLAFFTISKIKNITGILLISEEGEGEELEWYDAGTIKRYIGKRMKGNEHAHAKKNFFGL
jgi:hypothetical protein